MKLRLFSLGTLVPIFLGQSTIAADLYWDNGIADGAWGTASNWSSDLAGTDTTAIPGSGDTAYFNITGLTTAQSIALGASRAVTGLVFNNSGGLVTLTGAAGQVLTIGSAGIKATGSTTNSSADTKVFTIASSVSSVQLTGNQSWEATFAPASGSTVRATDGLYILAPVTLAAGVGDTTLTLGGNSGSSTTPLNRIGGVISDGANGALSINMAPTAVNGRWSLSGNNTYTGATTVTNGALTISHANALGSTASGTTVESGGSVLFRATVTGTMASEAITLNGQGVDLKGALRNVTGTNTWNGAITANTGTTGAPSNVNIGAGSAASFTIASGITTDTGGSLNFTTDTTSAGQTATITVTGGITGGANVKKIANTTTVLGNGILVLSGVNKTYTGTTNVDVGILTLNTGITGTSAVTVGTGVAGNSATLRGDGGAINTAATTTISSTGTLTPGLMSSTIGALSMGSLNLAAASTLAIDINSTTSQSDLITITGNLAIDASNAAILTLGDLGSTALSVGTIIDIVRYSGTWNGGLLKFGSAAGPVIGDESTTVTAGLNTFQVNYDRTSGADNFVSLIVVPEPSALALSGGALLILGFRRRR